ncbi:MAG: UMP kinase [Marinilabiliales bacterium]|jgi:uridylate kinase|nr:MAG: UMP kinase [Marinilabiliales bacterium]
MKYKRILLKLSGEALMGEQSYGIDPEQLEKYGKEIIKVAHENVQIAIVIGGGNIFRGIQGAAKGFDRIQGDYMGMLATVINSVALQSELEKLGAETKLLSGLLVEPVTEKMNGKKAIEYLEQGKIVIISGGTGNPVFTTDSASALRSIEIKADALLKGTRVDGVYTADPERDKSAKKFDKLSFDEAYEKQLKIMDMTAFTLCRENNIPIVVFNMNQSGNLYKVVTGEDTGTIINNEL